MRITPANNIPCFTRGLSPTEAIIGLGHRAGFATVLEDMRAGQRDDRAEDLLIPQGIGCWTCQWMSGLEAPELR